MPESAVTPLSVPIAPSRGLSPTTLGAIAIADGLVALAIVALGSGSWILLGTALVVWILCGWAMFFSGRAHPPAVAALGYLLLLSAAAAALAVLSGMYLLALGPSWIL